MQSYKMNLQPKYFDYIKNGTKRLELRLFDEKRQKIKLGDIIIFHCDGAEVKTELRVRVVGLLRYKSFAELFENFDISILSDACDSKQRLLSDLQRFYSIEKQTKFGVLGILFEFCPNDLPSSAPIIGWDRYFDDEILSRGKTFTMQAMKKFTKKCSNGFLKSKDMMMSLKRPTSSSM